MKLHRPSIEALESRIAPATIYAVDANDHLLVFDSSTPGKTSSVAITGLGATERIEAIDFRPASGQLYALGITNTAGADEGRVYVLNVVTGALTPVDPNNTPFSAALQDNDDFGFDFNPVVDRIRLVTDRKENLRINPSTGALAATDTTLDDPNRTNETVIGAAYDHNFEGATTTTLYGIDKAASSLVMVGGVNSSPSPNGGVLTTVGQLGVTIGSSFDLGFDIGRDGVAYASMNVGGSNGLYTIDLATGAATLVGAIDTGGTGIRGLAVGPSLKIINATAATYTDADGDLVTVKVSKGKLSPDLFQFGFEQRGDQLKLLNLSAGGQDFSGANITITAKRTAAGGDGFVNVGYINATGVDLGAVTVSGDLGQIDAGDATATAASPGLRSLAVHSMGFFDLATQPPAPASLTSDITGPLGKLVVKTSMKAASIHVDGGGMDASGTIGSVSIGGSILAGGVLATGNIGPVKVLGNIVGGTTSGTGVVESGGNMGAVFIGGDVQGGTFDHTGNVHAFGSIASITIRGSILGGNVDNSALNASGLVYAGGAAVSNIGPVKIGGVLKGSVGDYSGSIFAGNNIASVTVGGSLLGDAGAQSGNIEAGGRIGAVKIGGSAIGGQGLASGSVYSFSFGSIASVNIAGSLIGGGNTSGIISAGGPIGAVKIGGDVRGVGGKSVVILAGGISNPATAAQALAIKSIAVRGDVSGAMITAGADFAVSGFKSDQQIGAITVGGNWIASSVAASAKPTNAFFGDADDAAVFDSAPSNGIVSRIASITIKGYATGSVSNTADSFGFVAREIGAIKVGSVKYSFTKGFGNDTAGILVGTGLDLTAREF